jgi:hypothetical protein
MDTIKLQQYHNPKQKVCSKNTSNVKYNQSTSDTFWEYYINDAPLSEQLDIFFNNATTLLENWTGVLTLNNSAVSNIKIKQLLGKKVTDEDIKRTFPLSWDEEEAAWYIQQYRDELNDPEILIYCCAECGDYDCGGIAILIHKTETSIFWTIKNEAKELRFEFDKYKYYKAFSYFK